MNVNVGAAARGGGGGDDHVDGDEIGDGKQDTLDKLPRGESVAGGIPSSDADPDTDAAVRRNVVPLDKRAGGTTAAGARNVIPLVSSLRKLRSGDPRHRKASGLPSRVQCYEG